MTAARRLVLPALAGLLLFGACSTGPELRQGTPAPAAGPAGEERLILAPVGFAELPGWRDDAVAQALPAMRRSCDKITRMPSSQTIGGDGLGGTAADWLAPCGAMRGISDGDHDGARAWFEGWFQPFRASNGGSLDGKFTGYYEAELRGARQAGGRYRVPLYPRPPGLPADPGQNGGAPYYSRAQIEAGALQGKVPALLWVDDAVDAHILHIQGSGRVLLDDGSMVRVGFNGSNGYKFQGLGKILQDHGKIPAGSSMQTVRDWLKGHPAEAPALMAENPRYVFFRLIQGDGPVGAQGVPLTPGRSLAVDPRFVPLGVPLWLDTTEPSGQPLRRMMVAQDAGTAIKGPIRGDVFWGAGEPALDKAGRMNSRGGYYLLLPRQRSGPIALDER